MEKASTSSESPTGYRARGWIYLALICLALAVVSWVCAHWDIDRTVSGLFFDKERGWFLARDQPWDFLYRYGTIPGLVLTLGATVGWICCLASRRWAGWRKYMALLALTSIIGAGVLVNGLLKPYWGRPRPVQIKEFTGEWEYRHVGLPGKPGKGQSFPSGHCTMGFVFVPLFFFRKRTPVLAWAGGTFGLVFGALMSVTRVVQGAHFVTDTVWSLGIVLMVAVSLYYFVLRIPEDAPAMAAQVRAAPKRRAAWALGILVLLIVLGFLASRPFFESHRAMLNLKPGIRALIVTYHGDYHGARVWYGKGEKGRILHESSGFGLPVSEYALDRSAIETDGTLMYSYKVRTKGYFSELSHQVTVILPQAMEGRMDVRFIRAKDNE